MTRLTRTAVLITGLVSARPAAAQEPPRVPPSGLEFTGLMYGSYNYHTDAASRATLGGNAPNQFSIDRAYLNFRMPAGENGLVRITADVFQNSNTATNAFYQGWALRLKYVYFQYTGLRGVFGPGSSLAGRVGAVHDVAIDQHEATWPRYLQAPPVERALYFASADAGIAGLLTLPHDKGELYATIVNGPGYQSFDRDRFKDVAIRAAFTPFASSKTLNGFARALLITPWYYKGATASAFASGGPGQIGPGTNGAVTDGLTRDRYGLYVGVKDRRFSVSTDYALRVDGGEAGANTAASPRTAADSTGRLAAAYIIARPFEWRDASKHSPISFFARYDQMTYNINPGSPSYAGATPYYGYTVLGTAYELTQRITVALDWQDQSPHGFSAALQPTARQTTWFAHWQAVF